MSALPPHDSDGHPEVRFFLDSLFAALPDGYYSYIWSLPSGDSFWFSDHLQAVEHVAQRWQSSDLYIPIGIARRRGSAKQRMIQDTSPGKPDAILVDGILALVADIDVGTQGHKSGKTYPPDIDTALHLVTAMPLPPSLTIHSGHGLHLWWLLDAPLLFADAQIRKMARSLARDWQAVVHGVARVQGYDLDCVQDLTRIMRIAGTQNHKSPDKPLPVALLQPLEGPAKRYAVSDLQVHSRTTAPAAGKRDDGVEMGHLFTDAAAEPPSVKFARLMDREAGFRDAWTRSGLRNGDNSASGYDWVLARYAAADGWQHQEIVDLLIAARRKHGSKSKSLDYYRRTISKVLGARVPREDAGDTSPRPRIDVSRRDLTKQVGAAFQAVETASAKRIEIVRHNGALCRLVRNESQRVAAEQLTEDGLRLYLAEHAEWYCPASNHGEKAAYPPRDCVRAMLAHPDPPVPSVRRIVTVPVVAADGHLIQEPGLYESGSIWYEPDVSIKPVPTCPTANEVAAARLLLLDDLLGDFPFADPQSRAYALAFLLLPIVRSLIDGPTPLHLTDARSGPGSGKTLLGDVLTLIICGSPSATIAEAENDQEWRKRITAELLRSPEFLRLDNLNRTLSSGALSTALTARFWGDRLLGQSRSVEIPISCTWMATGNSVRASREMTRRMVRITLDAKTPSPWRRDGFKHPNLVAWAFQQREELLRSALVIVANWLAAGRPLATRALGMFESWSAVMGGLLQAAGVDGLLEDLDDIASTVDAETLEWEQFINVWWQSHGETAVETAQLYGLAVDEDLLGDVLGPGNDRSQRSRLGRALSRMDGRCFTIVSGPGSGVTLTVPGTDGRKNTKVYQLKSLGECLQ